jgi:DivIVA domain-containing protein
MALDRHDIERTDFPRSRRGYEPEAVAAHLRRVADEVEELRRAGASGPDRLSAAASEQVRAIVDAAEATAADIRGQAGEEAREHVAAVKRATQAMLERVGELEAGLAGLAQGLRAGGERLVADLDRLEAGVGELPGAGAVAAAAEPAPPVEPAPAEPTPEPATAQAQEVEPAVEGPAAEAEAEAEPTGGTGEPAAAGGDSEGARLIALDMALSGTPREETERYLSENFQLEEQDKLLDEVYARVG